MSAAQANTDPSPPLASPIGLGASLKSARERAGLSLDQVAQQLKLAPRQVKALEEEDFAQLPGRTFARGFVRNYARLLNLDGDDLLALLPDAAHAPALASPSLHAPGSSMAEVPTDRITRPALGRWLIPLVLVAGVVAAGGYEWYRSAFSARTDTTAGQATLPAAAAPVAPASPPGTARSELANPLAATPAVEPMPSAERGGATEEIAATPSSGSAETPPSATPAAAPVAPGSATTTEAVAAASPAVADQPAALVLTYRAPSWTEVRDRNGQVVIKRVVAAGSEQAIPGTGPFDIVIGNAKAVTLSYRGEPIDLARYSRGNIARLHLP